MEAVKSLLKSAQFLEYLKSLLLKALKAELLGGFRGWLLKTLVKEFAEEVVEIVTDVTDYIIIDAEVDSTIGMEDRDEATDTLNDIMSN